MSKDSSNDTDFVDVKDILKELELESNKPLNKYLVYPYYHIRRSILDLPRNTKYWFQRRIRGYDDSDLWNIDSFILAKLDKMLPKFYNNLNGMPFTYEDKGEDAWKKDLKDFHKDIQMVLDEENLSESFLKEQEKARKRISDFLSKNLFYLWD